VGHEIHLTDDQLREWQALHRRYPGWGKRWELIRRYALRKGGLTLRFWQLHQGPAFGLKHVMNVEACAHRLRVPVSRLMGIHAETMAWVEPRLRKTTEWQELQKMDGEKELKRLRDDPP
jgi:hypothetical protein